VAIVMVVRNRHVTPRRSRRSQEPPQPRAPDNRPRGPGVILFVVTLRASGRWRWKRRRAIVGLAVLAAIVWGCDAGGDRPQGVVEHVTARDSSFGVYGDYSIYLPPGYGRDPRRRYPVVYLLHGSTDDDRFFLQLGLRNAMDTALDSGAVGPMLPPTSASTST
jgi:hypothetical protein